MKYEDYLSRHGQSERKICHCGKEFENTRYPGGPRRYGRKQIYCSPRCNQLAVTWRAYGLEPHHYWQMLESQGGVCAVCRRSQGDGDRQFAVDHDHVDGFADMSDEEKRKHVRGILCLSCNRWRVGKNDVQTAQAVVEYLSRFEGKNSA